MVRPVNAAAMTIANFSEGCVLRAYRDQAGVWTQGWGHTGPDVRPGSVVTQVQADAWRASDMGRAAAFVDAHVKVPLGDNQFSALSEFTYNTGVGAFLGSTLLRKLNKGQYDAIPAQLALWNKVKVNGKKVAEPGLTKRRQSEIRLWQTPDNGPEQSHLDVANSSRTTASPKPTPPSLIECIRAWFHTKTRVPA